MKRFLALIFVSALSFGQLIANDTPKQSKNDKVTYHKKTESDCVRITKGLAALTAVAACVFIDATVTNWLCDIKRPQGERFFDKYYNAISNFIKQTGLTGKHILEIDDSKMITGITLAIIAFALAPALAHYGWNKKLFPLKSKEKNKSDTKNNAI